MESTHSEGLQVVQEPHADIRHVFQDEDEEDAPDAARENGQSEPEWLRKRRRLLQEAQRKTTEAEDYDHPTFTGKLTKQKPAKHAHEVRFKIDRQKDTLHPIVLSGPVKQLGFDATGSVLAVLGTKEKCMRLFQVDEHRSKGTYFRLKGEMKAPEVPGRNISSFCFANEVNNIFMVADRKHVMKYNIEQEKLINIASITNPRTEGGYRRVYTPDINQDSSLSDIFALSCADNGGVMICDGKSNAIIHHLQMNAQAMGVAFHLRSNAVITADDSANIYEWDLTTGKCLHKFNDQYSVHISTIAVSPAVSTEFSSSAFLFTGSRTGFLNRYLLSSEPYSSDSGTSFIQKDVVKSYGNLATAVTSIAAETSGKFTAYASEHKRSAVRIVHNPSGNVIGNWPTDQFNLGRITDMSFCSKFNTLAIGNRHGKVQFFRIFTT
ncbi:U3 small nucleolar RNA-associated protein 18 [Babesia gibsoni]|uniref:U3 small nucleolar RNA-associated protein 18 n=1 Tax=Babesia gibsoni TaxID=33632 RepID=A0AAD8UT64_BABGI|nr:U3 small nucleolar RNA-associated protein 18 [Babesia gibsoni]